MTVCTTAPSTLAARIPLTPCKAFQEGAPCTSITPLAQRRMCRKRRLCSSLMSLWLAILFVSSHKLLLCCAGFCACKMIICSWLIVSSKGQAQMQSPVWSPGCDGENWRKARSLVLKQEVGRAVHPTKPSFLFFRPCSHPCPGLPSCRPLCSTCGLRLWKPQSKSLSLKPLVFFCFFPSLLMVKRMDWPLSELRVTGAVDLESNLAV